MASENETVEQACEILYAYPKAEVCDGNGLTVLNNNKIADRIVAAHKREIAELRECLEEAIYSSCVKCTLYNSRRRQCSYSSGACGDVEKWRKALEGESREGK